MARLFLLPRWLPLLLVVALENESLWALNEETYWLRGWDILEGALLFAYPVVEKQCKWKEGGREPELFVICKSGRLGGGGGQTEIPAYLSRGRLGVGSGE